jgi:drug/metabolite transporter (DMT)-like permease
MDFFFDHQGEWFALSTAIFWTITALAFESASLKVGSLSVNIIRLILGFLFLSFFTLIQKGEFLPVGGSYEDWIWLSISGLIGFVLGDLFLFKSYTLIGSRYAMLIMALVPPIAAFFSFILMNEKINGISYLGMGLTLFGIGLAILGKKGKRGKIGLKLSPIGVLYAFGGAFGQALGLVLSKKGMQQSNAFTATQIRIIAGIVGFAIIITFMKRWRMVVQSLTNGAAMKGIITGSFFGPFLGVSFSLLAIAHTATGIASTIMAIVPILILPPAFFIYKQRVTIAEIFGAVISVAGVALFFIF